MKNKKILSYLGILPIATLPVVTLISCSDKDINNKITIALQPYSNANFVKYLQAGSIACAYTQPLIESMPNSRIKNREQLQKVVLSTENGGYYFNSKYGLVEPSSTGGTLSLTNGGTKLSVKMREDAKWENGQPVTAHNIVSTLQYVMNISTGSELEFFVERYGILNAAESYKEQREYARKNGSSLADPFAPSSPLPASKNLGIKAIDDYTLEISFNRSYSANALEILSEPFLWPTNKDFIESHGGIDDFGLTQNSIISNGAYIVKDIDFDYGVILEKSKSYWNKDSVYLKNINLRFVSDQNLQAALFKDKLVSNALVPKEYVNIYWSDPELREFLKRGTGLGTLALILNSKPDRANSWLVNDINFRKALMYGINKERVMDLTQMNFSIPVGVLTARVMQNARTGEGHDLLEYMVKDENSIYELDLDPGVVPSNSLHVDKNDPSKAVEKLNILPYMLRQNSFKFEDIPREDTIFDENISKMYINRLFKSQNWISHMGNDPIEIEYAYDTANKISEEAATSLKETFRTLFQGKISLNNKPYPSSTFNAMYVTGKWDLTYKQLDPISNSAGDYVGMFVEEDSLNEEKGKLNGYYTNPTGYTTYKKYFNDLINSGQEEETRKRLRASELSWDFSKLISTDLVTPQEIEENRKQGKYSSSSDVELKLFDEINSFIKWFKVHSGDYNGVGPTLKDRFQYFENTMKRIVTFDTIYPVLEKLIRDMVPVIPIAEADNKWTVSTIAGNGFDKRGWYVNPEYVYDVLHKPFADLPGKEILKDV